MNDETTRDVLAKNLQKILKDKEWSARQLARESGDPVMTINNIVNGRNLPKAGVLVRVAEALDVPISSLFATGK